MKYYSEGLLSQFIEPRILKNIDSYDAICKNHNILHVRRCRDCQYFERDHPTIDTDGDFGYCSYKTDFMVLDDESILWYFTDINGFCNEDEINDSDCI